MADAGDNENRPLNRSTPSVRFRRSDSSSSTGSSAQGDDGFYHRGSADKDTDWRSSRHRSSSSSTAQSTGVHGRSDSNWRGNGQERSRSDWRDRQSSSRQYHDYHRPLGTDETYRKRADEQSQAECDNKDLEQLEPSSSSEKQSQQCTTTCKSTSCEVAVPLVENTCDSIWHSSPSMPFVARGDDNKNWQASNSKLPSEGSTGGSDSSNWRSRSGLQRPLRTADKWTKNGTVSAGSEEHHYMRYDGAEYGVRNSKQTVPTQSLCEFAVADSTKTKKYSEQWCTEVDNDCEPVEPQQWTGKSVKNGNILSAETTNKFVYEPAECGTKKVGKVQFTGTETLQRPPGGPTGWQDRKVREPVSFLERLKGLADGEPSDAVICLESPRNGLLKYFKFSEIKDTRLLQGLVKALHTACQSNYSPCALNSLLQKVLDSGFLTGPLFHYLTSTDGDAVLVTNVAFICKTFLHHLPSFSLSAVTLLQSQLAVWGKRKKEVSQCHVAESCVIRTNQWKIGENRNSQKDIESACLAIAETEEIHKDVVKQIKRGDVVRDQEIADEGDIEQPPDDFRKIPLIPTQAEINSSEPPFLRKNIIYGAYRDVDHYLDVQYRLLREDFVCPLREGLKVLKQHRAENIPLGRLSDVRFYRNVYILSSYCSPKCVIHKAQFDVLQFRHVDWTKSKRLISGSLVGLSQDNFRHIVFGTVVNRNVKDIQKGEVEIWFDDSNSCPIDGNPFHMYEMIECSAYFEAYRHVLQGLQEIGPERLPFEKFLLNHSVSVKDVGSPLYLLRRQKTYYDFTCLLTSSNQRIMKCAKAVPILNSKAWPPKELLGLDDSQYSALKTAVTKEFVAIQGPPGTGKTFVGLKIVQLLLHNCEQWNYDGSPILIVCYTNHALDQFLEGIIQICHTKPNELVRVGGRSSSQNETLEACSLYNLRKSCKVINENVRNARIDVMTRMRYKTKEIAQLTAWLECARKFIIHENYLLLCMTHEQYDSLVNGTKRQLGNSKISLLLLWLQAQDFDAAGFDNDVVLDDGEDNTNKEVYKEEDSYLDDNDFRAEFDQALITTNIRKKCEDRMCVFKETDNNAEAKDGEFQIRRRACRKRHNRIMSDEEWAAVHDVWQLSVDDRWRLYNHWASDWCEETSVHIQSVIRDFNTLANHKLELDSERDIYLLGRARIVGMTTTCAAKNRRLIQRVHPKIVIVEEAAEVLEAHIVTTLSARCEHLIMIGDHQQLRPNPTVYKLAKQYHLDISLFERMVKNDLHCDRLTIQHRMRPEIVKLIVPHIYKSLDNHESVLNYKHVPNIAGNVFFITHNEEESSVDDSKSHSNLHEARFLTALCHYLLQQGYKPSQITVLTMYTGQMFLLKSMIKPIAAGEVRVTPVDNFQGEENDIILLSLVRSNEEGKIGFLEIHNRVCVALSRARMGLYVVGNMDLLAGASSLWCGIVKQLEGDGRLVSALPLGCQFHFDSAKAVFAKLPGDFDKVPDGGCQLQCGFKHSCGHVCEHECHADDRLHINEYRCNQPCVKIACKNGHICTKWCGDDCSPCKVLVEKIMPICDHLQTMECHVDPLRFNCQMSCEKLLPECGHQCQNVCGNKCTTKCSIIVPDREWPCGHLLNIECHKNPDNSKCDVMIEKELYCGHSVSVKCHEKSKVHVCQKPCEKALKCDHQCQEICSKRCTTHCSVIMPDREWPCGHLLSIECYKNPNNSKCDIIIDKELDCGHSATVQCHESVACQQPCERTLKCGHQCTNKCGEQCTKKCLVIVADREWPCGHKLTKECHYNSDTFSCDSITEKKLPCGHVGFMKCSFNHCMEKVKYTRCGNELHVYETECYQLNAARREMCQVSVPVVCSRNPEHTYRRECCDRYKQRCSVSCRVELSCGHRCSGTCHSCTFSHAPCRATVSELLPCQHLCKVRCGCELPKCYETCTSHCGHNPCRKSCSDVCEKCTLPCCWSCPHAHCDLRCFVPCTRAACNEPCPKRLRCGHRCIGLCGEPCPPFCATCNSKIISNIARYLKLANYSKRLTRFVYLEPCRHVIEVNSMDQWVERSCVDVLQPVTCPVCKMIVGHCPRYNALIKQYTIRCNELKQASTVTEQLPIKARFAIESFAPDDIDRMMKILLEDPRPDDDVVKDEISRMMQILLEDAPKEDYTSIDCRLNLSTLLSFQSLSLGAVCVWHQCWDLVQLLCKETDNLDIKELEQTLVDMKTALRKEILTTAYLSILRNVEKLQTLFIVLNVHRMLTFITNQRLRSVLNKLLASKSNYDGALSWEIEANCLLKTNFNIRHRNDIEDYLEHLNLFFQPALRDQIRKPRNDAYVRGFPDRSDRQQFQVTVKITDIIQDVLYERRSAAAV